MWYAAHRRLVSYLDGREGDFVFHHTGEKVEVKTDWYEMSATQNFFFERYSSGDKPGGPWQAQAHGCRLFVYFFIHDMSYFIFPVEALIEALEKLAPKGSSGWVHVQNKGYTTRGFLVKRAALADIGEQWHIHSTPMEVTYGSVGTTGIGLAKGESGSTVSGSRPRETPSPDKPKRVGKAR